MSARIISAAFSAIIIVGEPVLPEVMRGMAAVPELSTWAMLGIGFAGIGLAGLTRRRTGPRYAF